MFQDLSDEQAAAVQADSSVLLLACPGSGKTRTLTHKLARALEQSTSGKQFYVAITYTHRAAEEIEDRVAAMGVSTDQLWIGTIHSFCLEWILRPYFIYDASIANGFSIVNSFETEKLLESICSDLGRAYPRVTHWDCHYHFDVSGQIELESSDERKHETIRAILARYHEALRSNRELDFELLLKRSLDLISSIPQIARNLANLMPLILVDEYQDTNAIQYAILAAIARHEKTDLFMVGDPNQAIYGSLGGHAMPIAEMEDLFGISIRGMTLTGNYRSAARVIDFLRGFEVDATGMLSLAQLEGEPTRVSYNLDLERGQLAEAISRIVRDRIAAGTPPTEICIVAPQWTYLAPMTRALATLMPDVKFDGPGQVPFARDPDNFWYKVARIGLTRPHPSRYVRRLRWAGEVLADLQVLGLTSPLDRRGLLRASNLIVSAEDDGMTFLEHYFDELFSALQVDWRQVGVLSDSRSTFFASARERIDRMTNEGHPYLASVDAFRNVFELRTGVTISTIHGVKGTEFDVVVAFGLLEDVVPHFSDPQGDRSARKLIYVAGSRARTQLFLISETGRVRPSGTYEPTHVLAGFQFDYDEWD